jgi:SAM-dependent methyltransferase
VTDGASCVVCGGRNERWCRKLDRDVFRCDACGHITVPAGLMRNADGVSIYESDESIFEADGNAEYYLDETNAVAARAKLAFVTQYARPRGRLLDVGASFGHFLAEARTRFEAHGIEVSPSAVAWARKTFDVDIDVGSIYQLGDGTYEAVTCWDVIEHLEDPAGAIDQMRCRLAPGGRLFLSTPDAGSLVARVMGVRWHYLDPVQHLHLFSRRNLVRLLSRHGLSLVGYRHFGRSYRVRYVVNRLHYLARGRDRGVRVPVPAAVADLALPIKLWDVMGLVAEAA